MASLFVLAAGLRAYRIGAPSLWYDERCSLEASSGIGMAHSHLPIGEIVDELPHFTGPGADRSWVRIWTTMNEELHPPLYAVLLRSWRKLLGEGEAAVRSLSAAWSLAAVGLLCVGVRELNGRGPALLAGLFSAVAAVQIFYAQEARGYAMAGALMAGAAVALARIERRGPSACRLIALGGCVLAAMLTHYFTVGALGGLGMYASWRLRGQSRSRVLLVLLAAGVVFGGIWAPFLLEQLRYMSHADLWLRDDQAGAALRTVLRALQLPVMFLVGPRGISATGGAGMIELPPLSRLDARGYAAIAVGAGMFVLPMLVLHRKPDVFLWYLMFLGSVGFVTVLDLVRSTTALTLTRYTLVGAVPMYGLLAGLLWHVHGRWKDVPSAVLVLACTLGVSDAYRDIKPHWGKVAARIDPSFAPGEVFVCYGSPNTEWFAGALALGLSQYVKSAPGSPVLLLTQPATPVVLEQLRAKGLWTLVQAGGPSTDALLPGSRELTPPEEYQGVGTLRHVQMN